MNRSHDTKGKRIELKSAAIVVAFVVVTLPSMYVLSMGPMLWLGPVRVFVSGWQKVRC